ncbi:MAG TPA: mucoidy inhibitor MuiA family protein [bacterium (Candidatus Stahlbacteria)]|nr:mucoidy inhibitor MuiA family protein [Candidatus Stahlbacteria bacterium]
MALVLDALQYRDIVNSGGVMETKIVKSRIDSVIIYTDRVMVTRVADLEIKEPINLIFPDLPGGLEDQSVRIMAKDLQVGEVLVKPGYIKVPHPKVKEIETKIKKLEIKDRSLSDEIAIQQEKEKFLQAISIGGPEVISKEILTGKVSPESWGEGLKFLSDELIKIKGRIAEIERERVELKKKLDGLRAELNDIQSYVQNRKSIIFDAHPDGTRKYTIKLRYILYGASWRTYYELRARPSEGAVDLSYFGKVIQRTGEDWEDARIILSTAKPAYGGGAPEPYPWYLDLYLPRPKKKEKRAATRAIETAPAEAEALDEELAMTEVPPVEAGISIIYPLPGKHTIRSGEPERKMKITDASFGAEFKYFIMPRYDELSYLTGKFKNKTDHLFLEGDGGTYVSDDFTGNICLPIIAPDKEVTISFGIDERVEVKRKIKKSKVSQGGLVKKSTRYEFAYENRIKNFHDKKVDCEIVDQVPVAQNPNIKVSNVKFDPEPTNHKEKELGIFRWEVSIDPGKEFKLETSFEVEAPPDRQVEGLM